MSEGQLMWFFLLITPLALWMTVPSYIEQIQDQPQYSQTTPRG